MHIRLLQAGDVTDLVDMIYDVYGVQEYTHGSPGPTVEGLQRTIIWSLNTPEAAPTFVHDADSGGLSGFLFGHVCDTLFGDEKWFREQVFFIRPKHRSLPLAQAFVDAVEDWCKEQGIPRVELGNGVNQDARITRLYRRLGYYPVNTVYARRIV